MNPNFSSSFIPTQQTMDTNDDFPTLGGNVASLVNTNADQGLMNRVYNGPTEDG